jgi:UDP-N-acetylglucosamine--N-acetylmuramyl-(pentapeptide) pyrophosphoryl-undecaprenol N-acetylglucosamine transferase
MRIIISGGGTGGHIYPAITIARILEKTLREAGQPATILFVGTKAGLEADIIPKEGYKLRTIDVQGFERRLSFKNVQTVVKIFGSLWESYRIIQEFKPDIVIGTGGYVCGPVLLAASLLKKATLIQEQNVIAGMTNKLLARFVDCVAVGYAEASPGFSAFTKVIVSGNPIRPDVMTATREQSLQELGLDPRKKTLLVSGGSRGARSINQAMIAVHQSFHHDKSIQILHITGQSEYNSIVGILHERGIYPEETGNIMIIPYLYNMPQALASADLAVFRAGAIGLAELTARAIPSILVPYPYAAANHQEYNARVLQDHGAAVVLQDSELTGEKLTAVIRNLFDHPEQLADMAAASQKLGRPEAAKCIAEAAMALVAGQLGGK